MLLRDKLHLCELVRPHAARANIPHLPALDEVMQRLHRLLDWRVAVEAVDLEEVDVVGVEPLERRVDGVENRGARQPALVHVVGQVADVRVLHVVDGGFFAERAVALGQDDELVAREGEFFDRAADELFAH
jgi:hypothetical protein